MVFALMGYRDAWMNVGKRRLESLTAAPPAPLHLVLVEEPEAYLHAQVQQVFIKNAYSVLRNHVDLGPCVGFATQLVVSTHSSHVVHACDFSSLRYFRRLPSSAEVAVPTACVINLSDVFGDGDKTARFVARYLRATHCDLFFADGAVFIEGAAERILVPHFVEERAAFEYLRSCYISWLEIGGSHAHRFQKLVEKLGLTTLIITDIDAKDPQTGKSVPPKRGEKQETRNETLRTWCPKRSDVDDLLDLAEADKAISHRNDYGVRAAYQTAAAVVVGETVGEALANTFEDALLYGNVAFFKGMKNATGLANKFSEAASTATSVAELQEKARIAITGGGNKAEFALELLFSDEAAQLQIPAYIEYGLAWLMEQLRRREEDLAPKVVMV